jgi:hypothetical protein
MTGGGSDAGRKGFTSRVLAVTEVESAAMWAVKAATKPPLPEKGN